MIQCPECGKIDWDSIPTHKDTLELLKDGVFSTARELADHQEITISAASNRLTRLEELGVIESIERRRTDTGGFEKLWEPIDR